MSRWLGLHRSVRIGMVLAALVVCFAEHGVADAQVRVRGYYRKDGTYVRSHYRSHPDGNFANNWSTKGNINPYTGKPGTKVTPPSHNGRSNWAGPYSGGSYLGVFQTYTPGPSVEVDLSSAGTSHWTDNPHYKDIVPTVRVPLPEESDRLREIAEFNYHGIGFSTTHAEFMKSFPHAVQASPVDAAGVVSYAIDDVDDMRDSVWFQFVDQRFFRLVYAYQAPRVNEYGGIDILLDRAEARFGTPHQVENQSSVWRFPAIDRLILANTHEGTWYLAVVRLSLQQEIDRESKKVEVGF